MKSFYESLKVKESSFNIHPETSGLHELDENTIAIYFPDGSIYIRKRKTHGLGDVNLSSEAVANLLLQISRGAFDDVVNFKEMTSSPQIETETANTHGEE